MKHASVHAWWLASVLVLGVAGLVPAHAAVLAGRAVSVHDGDTLTVLDKDKNQHRIRLEGIDAPELGQAFGRASREHLASLVAGREVSVEWRKYDKYRRIVGKVLIGGLDTNLAQVRAGMAWHYKKYAAEQSREDRERYDLAEQEARSLQQGLWQDINSDPPWDFRHQRTKK